MTAAQNGAPKFELPPGPARDEHVDWRDLDFVTDAGWLRSPNCWTPPEIPVAEDNSATHR